MLAFRQYDRIFDEYLKVQSFVYWEAQPTVDKADAQRGALADDKDGPALPLAGLLLPGVKNIFAARTRTDRNIAALRCVEALRLHAARAGALPPSLDEIEDAPVPADPFTGRPFNYRLAGDRAFLSGADLGEFVQTISTPLSGFGDTAEGGSHFPVPFALNRVALLPVILLGRSELFCMIGLGLCSRTRF